jgi:hypothetical protein
MRHWRTAFWQHSSERPPAFQANPCVKRPEDRTVLTPGLVVVPNPVDAGQNIFGAAAIAANDIWGVGSNAFIDPTTGAIDVQPLAEPFNGKSWSVGSTPPVPSGAVNPPNARFFGVAGASSNDVWAVGMRARPDNPDFGETLIEHWNGSSWSVVASPTATVAGTNLREVSAVSANDVWAVGGPLNGAALVEHWDGTSWSVVSSPAFAGVGLVAVSADASNDVWPVSAASMGSGAPISGPPVPQFNGTSWSLATIPSARNVNAVTAHSPTNVWTVGAIPSTSVKHKGTPQVEDWAGTSWSIVTSPVVSGGGLTGVAAISANDIWAVGTIGFTIRTLTEHWDGTSWSVIPGPNPAENQDELFGVTALRRWDRRGGPPSGGR